MKRKIGWLILSSLIVIALLLSSCGGQEPNTTTPTTGTTATTNTPTVKPTTTPTTTPTVKPTTPVTTPGAKDVPKYGGIFTTAMSADVTRGFDPYRYSGTSNRLLGGYVYEGLGIGDRAKGPGGTNEWPFTSQGIPLKFLKGALAESWEVSADGLTITMHLRKGIHFQNKPPVNGRELVASDVKFTYDRLLAIGGGFTLPSVNKVGLEAIKEITTPDKYTVVFSCSRYSFYLLTVLLAYRYGEIYPPECISLPGGLDEWKNVNGTGPFILTDYVAGSSLTFTRNPDYWSMDELHPNNRLPYVDEYRSLIMPDLSTELTAMRIGRVDSIGFELLDWRTAESLKKAKPDLQFGVFSDGVGAAIYMQNDIKPYNDLRVRMALQMSLDRPAINKLLGPDSEPYHSVLNKGYGPELYTPFEELPKNIQEIYTYNPTKAKQLLAEAGYPNGFKMDLVLNAADVRYSSPASIAADYFGRIGVQVDIQVKESAIADTLGKTGTYLQSIIESQGTVVATTRFESLYGPTKRLRHNDQEGEALWIKASATQNDAERNKLLKQLNLHVMENVLFIATGVLPNDQTVMQPWVKGWFGEAQLRFYTSGPVYARLWLDRD